MRDYAKVGPRFWTGETGKYLRRLGRDAQVIGFYLFTCPNSNMLGLYYLPLPTLGHETGIEIEVARAVLTRLDEAPLKPLSRPFEGVFARYDELSETVFVTEMARHQIGERLTKKDNRHKAVLRELEQYRKSPFFNDFLLRYRDHFELQEMELSKVLTSPFGVPSKPGAGAGAGERTETGAGESETRARASPPGNGVIDYGTNLTRSAEDIAAEREAGEVWRTTIGLNVAAMEAWLEHCAKLDPPKELRPHVRLEIARMLSGWGTPAEQLGIVRNCIANGWKNLRKVEGQESRGSEAPKKRWEPPPDPPESGASR